MAEQDSHSIPVIWRRHKRLWDLNRQSLNYQINEAKEHSEKGCLEMVEPNDVNQEKTELLVGELAVSMASE